MILKTYLSKVNTIVEDSELNTGLNPISELIYGATTTRLLVYFDIEHIKEELNKNGITEYNTIHHVLKLTNCGFVNSENLYKTEDSIWGDGVKLRASSFDLVFFTIPQEWDEGKGFDYSLNVFNQGYSSINKNNAISNLNKLTSMDGCNWYQAKNGYDWKEKGVFSNETLSKEYDKFSAKEDSIIIARQHFDKGAENINVDISDTVNKMLKGEIDNFGIGIAFTPMTELIGGVNENYVGFFTNHTNTFFEPFLETFFNNEINDDRNNFILNKNNKLYLYCNIGGYLTNLDELPTCTVEGSEMAVKQASEGVYYIELCLSDKDYPSNTMLYDIWSNIKYKGTLLSDVELDFVTKPDYSFFKIGASVVQHERYEPIISGIKHDERILRGDKRKIVISSRSEYSRNNNAIVDKLQYRIYIKDGGREITVIDYDNVNKALNENYFIIDTKMLIPQRYYVDLKYNYGLEELNHKNVLSFDIVDDITDKYIK